MSKEQLTLKNNKALPPLGFGFMRLPVFDENDRSTVNMEAVAQMVDCYMERGFGYFDTAHRYNDEASEPALRKTLVERYSRDRFWLTDKITLNYIKKPEDQKPFFERQLELCGTDYFDLYMIHNVGRASFDAFEHLRTFRFLQGLRESGRIRHLGFSFHGTANVLEHVLAKYPDTEFVQLQINYLDWEDAAIQSRKCYEVARKYGCRILVMEPVKGGTLVNLPKKASDLLKEADPQASLASWAIRFAAGLEGVSMVLSGMSSLEQVQDNTSFMTDFKPLTEKELDILRRAAEIIHDDVAVACTGCRYCTAECPENIAIPDYFSLYNNMQHLENTGYMYNQKVYYANLATVHGKASDCIGCGQCEENCPQHLPVRSLLEKVAEALE
ncbi:MAG: aldo/keto reductase [Ruminococcus sp.]|jgi:predicted aldo/keto reductase-like oxidoreductase